MKLAQIHQDLTDQIFVSVAKNVLLMVSCPFK